MPGVVMDNVNVGGAGHEPGIHESKNGLSNPGGPGNSTESRNGATHVNGVSGNASGQLWEEEALTASGEPPALVHITQGFFPFSMLVNRSVQQCWNDLSEMIAELAEIQVPSQDQSFSPHGKVSGNQISANVQKKLRLLDFAHAKRAEFIKLLVLSQWSRQAADVSRLIDLQGFIRTRHQAYAGAIQWVGDMKRDLVMAQVANPDLKTALEVLSKGRVMAMSDVSSSYRMMPIAPI
jgi:mediator of RNA polymerase II transcription subunit 14